MIAMKCIIGVEPVGLEYLLTIADRNRIEYETVSRATVDAARCKIGTDLKRIGRYVEYNNDLVASHIVNIKDCPPIPTISPLPIAIYHNGEVMGYAYVVPKVKRGSAVVIWNPPHKYMYKLKAVQLAYRPDLDLIQLV